MEWHSQDKFNSYNSWKGLLYQDYYKHIAKWYKEPNHKILPAIEASIDSSPGGACNLRCKWCNAYKYLGKTSIISDKQLLNTVKFLVDWGVKAFCIGGGGEPTLRKNLVEILLAIGEKNKQSSIVTNGILFKDELIESSAKHCRWIGFSVDAATPKTYELGKSLDRFNIVINNIKKSVKKVNELKSNCDISYKFLATPWNYKEIYQACKLAKEIGVKDFHVRVADLSHQGMGEQKLKEYSYAIKKIEEQFKKSLELRTNNFRVFCPTHKFDINYKPYKNFKQCWAMPLLIQCCPDGNVYSCVDQRLQPFYRLGSYVPDPKNILNFWGKEKHWNLTFKTGRKHCNTRCTFTAYCEQCEKLFIEEDKDHMCKWFT